MKFYGFIFGICRLRKTLSGKLFIIFALLTTSIIYFNLDSPSVQAIEAVMRRSYGFSLNVNTTEKLKEDFMQLHFAKIDIPEAKTRTSFTYRTKILIMTHLAGSKRGSINTYTFGFSAMLYASWKYVLLNYKWASNSAIANKVDLLAYYSDELTGDDFPENCAELAAIRALESSKHSDCFTRKIKEDTLFEYKLINDFIFLRDPLLEEIIYNYDYIVRTDSDVFITPRLFDWRIPTEAQIIFGWGAYSTTFNKEQLGRIAEELKWKRQGLGNVGSTWMVKPSDFVRLSVKARVSHLQRFSS